MPPQYVPGKAGTQDIWTRSTDPGCGAFCVNGRGQVMFWPVGYSILTATLEPGSANTPGVFESRTVSMASATTMATGLDSITHTAPTSDISQSRTSIPTTASSLRRKRSEGSRSEQSQLGESVAKKPKISTKPTETSPTTVCDVEMSQDTASTTFPCPEPDSEG